MNVMKESLDYKKYKTLSPLPEEIKLKFEKNLDSDQKDWKKPGLDLSPSATISFMEAVHGVEKEVMIPIHSFCKTCDNDGKIDGKICSLCGGKKLIITPKIFSINIPAGIDDGQYLVLKRGAMSKLRIKINVENHPKFNRKGYDIYSTEYFDAEAGRTVTIEVLDGKPVLHGISKMTEDVTQLCFKGRGIPMLKDKSVRGDHYVTLRKRPLFHKDQCFWKNLYDSLNKNNFLGKWEVDNIYQNLEMIFKTGGKLLVIQDYDYGIKLLKLAAMYGECQANLLLGYCYEQGIGVLKDVMTAKEYYYQGIKEEFQVATEEGRSIFLNFLRLED